MQALCRLYAGSIKTHELKNKHAIPVTIELQYEDTTITPQFEFKRENLSIARYLASDTDRQCVKLVMLVKRCFASNGWQAKLPNRKFQASLPPLFSFVSFPLAFHPISESLHTCMSSYDISMSSYRGRRFVCSTSYLIEHSKPEKLYEQWNAEVLALLPPVSGKKKNACSVLYMCAHTPIYVSSYCRSSSSPYTATRHDFFCLS